MMMGAVRKDRGRRQEGEAAGRDGAGLALKCAGVYPSIILYTELVP